MSFGFAELESISLGFVSTFLLGISVSGFRAVDLEEFAEIDHRS